MTTFSAAYKALKDVIAFLESKDLLNPFYRKPFTAVMNKLKLLASQENKK